MALAKTLASIFAVGDMICLNILFSRTVFLDLHCGHHQETPSDTSLLDLSRIPIPQREQLR